MTAPRTVPARDRRPDAADRIRALSMSLQEEFSTPFSFYDGSTGEPLGDRDAGGLPAWRREEVPPEVLAIAAGGRPHVGLRDAECFRLVLPIQEPDGLTLVAVGDLPALARCAQSTRLEQVRLQKWLQAIHSRFSFMGCTTISDRSDQAHVQQLKTLLEASRGLTDLLTGLESLGESGDDQDRILRRPRPCSARRP